MDVLSPEDVGSILSSPFFVTFWPLLVGAAVILVFLLRGYTRTTIPLAIIAAVIQAWHMGLFGEK
jgi:hypothetical protein